MSKTVTANCAYCNEPFTYEVRPGTRPRYCKPQHSWKASAERLRVRNRAATERWCPRGQHTVATEEFSSPTAPYCRLHMAEWNRADRRRPGRTREEVRASNLRRCYGLTPEQFDAKLAEQGGGCAICGTREPETFGGPQGWHVDHDHTCCPGKRSCGECIRGILCASCNWALGNFRDDPAIIQAALDYLLACRTRRESGGHINLSAEEDAAVTS